MADDASEERWLPVVGWEGLYEVSDQGRVWSVPRIIQRIRGGPIQLRGRILKPFIAASGDRYNVKLCVHGRCQTRLISHLVAEAFLGPRTKGMEVCHWDGNGTNDNLENLRYDTSRGNKLDLVRHGRHWKRRNIECPHGHLLIEPNLVVSQLAKGNRSCLACHRTHAHLGYLRRTGRDGGFNFQAESDRRYAAIMRSVAV